MKTVIMAIFRKQTFMFLIALILSSCISQFIPETSDDKELFVIEGLVTDQLQTYIVKLSKSQPLGHKYQKEPLEECFVSISDDLDNTYDLNEFEAGTYISDSTNFQGVVGRKYTLHISTNNSFNNLDFESIPMELKRVPNIDSLYYEKITITEEDENIQAKESCQIFVNTLDPDNNCRFYRWTYSETWEFRLPYNVPNSLCWISAKSDKINIKTTMALFEDKINRYPLKFISNKTDRLREKYSIFVTQYSLNEAEYIYWEKLRNVTENVGGLYDRTPSNIRSNVYCLNNPDYEVLGFFSVSSVTSKRIFIKDSFSGIVDLYTGCPEDTIRPPNRINGLGSFTWIIATNDDPYYRVITHDKRCYDCTLRGTNIEPMFWKDDEK